MTVTVDKYTRVLMTIIAVLLFVISVGMWLETPPVVATAQARIPDSGQQLNQIIQKTEQIRESLAGLAKLMTSGNIKVQIVTPTEKPKTVAPAPLATPQK